MFYTLSQTLAIVHNALEATFDGTYYQRTFSRRRREIQLLVHVLPPRTQIIPDHGSPSNHQHMAKDCLIPLLLEILTAGLQFINKVKIPYAVRLV